ncbi:hypothetical protein FGADI_3720 [Fusarium gaditjirri]|uniref:Uncharacterized protein n=1 Tax=Fusarium gaditjirri TaxID=282569 RepID=A0A8H4WZH4_9HYPO|nr:hypothetical protein FGADI_3720 [Fusarium gaditjirri]
MGSPSGIVDVAKTKFHVNIKQGCGLCSEIIFADEWTVACETLLHFLPQFCPSNVGVTQSYHQDDAMDPIWVASAWKFPWRHRPLRRKPRLDLTDMTLVPIGRPVAEAIGIPGLVSLPQEVLQMVRSYIPNNDFWLYSLIQNTAKEMSLSFQNPVEPEQDATRFSLATAKAWKRGVQGMNPALDESEPGPFIVRLTVDSLGLKEVQRLQDWPEYNHVRSNTCAYVFFTQGQANSSFISLKVSRLLTP